MSIIIITCMAIYLALMEYQDIEGILNRNIKFFIKYIMPGRKKTAAINTGRFVIRVRHTSAPIAIEIHFIIMLINPIRG